MVEVGKAICDKLKEMTRINAGINPSELCDQHLIAEYRELPRIFRLAEKYSQKGESPAVGEFTLGKGHMLFFVDKGRYLEKRWKAICYEMGFRGFNIKLIWRGWPANLNGDWKETIESRKLVQARILQRFKKMKMKTKPVWSFRPVPDWAKIKRLMDDEGH